MLDDEDPREERSRKSVTRKEVAGAEEKWPQPKACGHKVGTVSWIALSEEYSPIVGVSFSLILKCDLATCLRT